MKETVVFQHIMNQTRPIAVALWGFAFSTTVGCVGETDSLERDRIESLEKRIERLEASYAQVPPNITSIDKLSHNHDLISYDGYGGNLYAFSTLEPFDAKILHYEVLEDGTANGSATIGSKSDMTAWPTLRLVIASNRKLILLNNFRMLPGAIKTVDRLIEQPTCRLPDDLWALRASALTD